MDWTGKKVLVLGDVMLDVDIHGVIERECPEAPVPCVRELRREYRPGGAGNVAATVQALGGKAILYGVRGYDVDGDNLNNCRRNMQNWILRCAGRVTTVKQRVFVDGEMRWRLDRETADAIDRTDEAMLLAWVKYALAGMDAVVISDYGKGVCTEKICCEVIRLAREHGLPVVVDPKGGGWGKYEGCTVVKANRNDMEAAERRMVGVAAFDCVLETLGPQGMILYQAGNPPVELPASPDPDFPAIGAGDRVAAALALALATGASVEEAARAAAETVANFHKREAVIA